MRARVSTLGFAILGLLARADATGYELSRRMRQPIGYFWTARHSQVYPELARLTGHGLVDFEETPGRGPRTTKRYRITAAGRTALAAWVVAEHEPQPVRDLDVLRLWSAWTVEPDQARAIAEEARSRHLERLDRYRAELVEVTADPASRDPRHPLFASRITLEGGIRSEEASVGWAAWLLEQWPACSD